MNAAMDAATMGAWTAEHVGRITPDRAALIAPVVAGDHPGLDAGRLYWDMWPLQDAQGHQAVVAGRELWMALTAPDRGDPSLRHFEAKIHWLERRVSPRGSAWYDLGPVLPDGDVPYEREWAGSALCVDGVVTLFFTAAGSAVRAGGYRQELWAAAAPIGAEGLPEVWTPPAPLFARRCP
jgi:levansucrase